MTLKDARYPPVADDAPLVVFDFDHTLYDGDSGSHLFAWLIRRSAWRTLLAALIAPVAATMIAFLPTRRHGIGAFMWVGTVFEPRRFEALVDQYVELHDASIRMRLLPVALDVLHRHRLAGDRVVVATGAPPRLASAILGFAAHENVPVVGTQVERFLGGVRAARHCHHAMKMAMLRDAGFGGAITVAYTDSTADLPLLLAAARPVVVNPKPDGIDLLRARLPAGTPMLNWGCAGRAGDPVPLGG